MHNELDEWYFRELHRTLCTPKKKSHFERLKARMTRQGVYRERTSVYASHGRGSEQTSRFAGDTSQALCRTRTGDPFLTMRPHRGRLMACIALFLGVFWGCVGVGILWLLEGSGTL